MHRPNNSNKNLRNDESSRRLLASAAHGNEQDDDSRSQVDSEPDEGHPLSSSSSSSAEDSAPLVRSEDDDVEDYVKRLRKTGTADENTMMSGLKGGATMLAAKAGITYLARFGGMGNNDDIVDEDDVVGGAVVATKLSPQQQAMMNQMAPQASGAAAGGVAAPMASVVVPTPLGSAMASSAATTVRHDSIISLKSFSSHAIEDRCRNPSSGGRDGDSSVGCRCCYCSHWGLFFSIAHFSRATTEWYYSKFLCPSVDERSEKRISSDPGTKFRRSLR
jgi:hypothetical protein